MDLSSETRDFRTTNEQWKIIVDTFEEYPQMLKNKFLNFDGDRAKNHKLWEDMVIRLNSLGVGNRSVEKWKMAVGRWKSKVKAKARNHLAEIRRTGGGSPKAPPLNVIEERFMAILGWKAVTGDRDIIELGISGTKRRLPGTPSTSNTAVESNIDTSPGTSTAYTDTVSIKNELPRSAASTAGPTPRKRVSTTTPKTRKYVTLTKMHKENLDILQRIERNTQVNGDILQRIERNAQVNGEALQSIYSVLKELSDTMKVFVKK